MEKINLDYIEGVIAYAAFLGEDKEIICPCVVDFISEVTIQNETNRLILFGVRDFFKKHKTIPTVAELKFHHVNDEQIKTFADFCRGFNKFKKNEFTRPVLLGYIEEFFRQRLLNEVLSDSFIRTTAGENLDINDVYGAIEEAMSIHMMDDLGLNLFHDTEEYIEYLTSEDSVIPTGFPWLDQQLGGGFQSRGSVLYNFLAASNIGKSNFIKSVACNMSKQGYRVLIVSLEMPRYIYANRFIAEMADLDISRLKDEHERVATFLKQAPESGYGDIVIKDFATGTLTSSALGAYIRRTQKSLEADFDVVFVDYPELMKSTRNFGNRHDLAVANQYVEVRALSFYLETPFGVVAQLNRDGYNKEKPSMENVGNGIGIMQCSDWGGFLYATDEMKACNQVGLSIGKSRFGAVNRSRNYNVNENTLAITESKSEDISSPMDLSHLEDDDVNETSPEDYFSELFGEVDAEEQVEDLALPD